METIELTKVVEDDEPCNTCVLVGGYCGGSKHASCGCFDNSGNAISQREKLESMRDAATPERIERITSEQAWLQDSEAQETDGAGAIRLAMSILGGLILGIAIAMLSGCSTRVDVRLHSFDTQIEDEEDDSADGGLEPLGYGNRAALSWNLEEMSDGE